MRMKRIDELEVGDLVAAERKGHLRPAIVMASRSGHDAAFTTLELDFLGLGRETITFADYNEMAVA